MGTTTFYLRRNDLRRRLSSMTKRELKIIDDISLIERKIMLLGGMFL